MTRARDVANIDGVLTTKGDIYAATAASTPARLAVGNDGETLVADSSTSTGLRYQPTQAAGKNVIINGAFDNWQRGTTFTASGSGYTADRFWIANASAGTIERSTDVPSGFAYSFFANGATGVSMGTPLELPATGAPLFTPGTPVTLSFYAKASTSTTMTPNLYYRDSKFSGANQSTFTGSATAISITSSWARYSYTYTASTPNATNTILGLEFSIPSTVRITGLQLEVGSVATPFQTATGTLQGELAACQRYYWRNTPGTSYGRLSHHSPASSSTSLLLSVQPPISMRVNPTSVDYGNITTYDGTNIGANITAVSVATDSNNQMCYLSITTSSLTQYRPYQIMCQNNTAGYLGLSAEL